MYNAKFLSPTPALTLLNNLPIKQMMLHPSNRQSTQHQHPQAQAQTHAIMHGKILTWTA